MNTFHHEPVLLREVLDWLDPVPGGVYADGTLGGGGHAEAVLAHLGDTGRLFGIDRDGAAIDAARARLAKYPGFTAVRGNFHDVRSLLADQPPLSGALLDLGVSSYQLDTPERGFSYHEDAPLDMRMDVSGGATAAQWLADVDEAVLTKTLYDYGDEKWAARIAKVLCERRQKAPILTTSDLVAVVDAAIPKKVRQKDSGHPARRTFQAVRIAVNDELAPLANALNNWVSLLAPGARLCVITFHSIEDRIVKRTFQNMQNPCVCPPKAPICTCGMQPVARVLAHGAIMPSESEVARNPRARSAKLRVVERIQEG